MSFRLPLITSSHAIRVITCGIIAVALGACAHGSTAAYSKPKTFPGVQILPTPTGGFSMRILGGMVGRGQPLYVVDGERVTVEPSRGIDWFDADDIVTVQVLKDPSEITVYGPSGANGVIVITTKRTLRHLPRGNLDTTD